VRLSFWSSTLDAVAMGFLGFKDECAKEGNYTEELLREYEKAAVLSSRFSVLGSQLKPLPATGASRGVAPLFTIGDSSGLVQNHCGRDEAYIGTV